MSIREDRIHSELNFKEKDIREVKYIWNYLCYHHPKYMKNKSRQPSSLKFYIEDLNNYINSVSSSYTYDNFSEAKEEYSRIKIEDSDFTWIDTSNPRLCNWVWFMIKMSDKHGCLGNWSTQQVSIDFELKEMPASFINNYSPPQIAIKPKEQFDSIVSYFDMIEIGKRTKLGIINTLRKNWNYVNGFSFKWLDVKDKAQCEWAWDYISKSNRISEFHKLKVRDLLNPSNHKQQRDMAIAMFDSWPAISDSKELFLRDMRKSWSQQKYRMKQSDKKSYSFLLKPETKAMLDEMAEKESMKQSEYLDLLIRSSYV